MRNPGVVFNPQPLCPSTHASGIVILVMMVIRVFIGITNMLVMMKINVLRCRGRLLRAQKKRLNPSTFECLLRVHACWVASL